MNPIEGAGWGRKALEFVEHEARAIQVRSIHLEVVRENAPPKRSTAEPAMPITITT